MISQSVIYPLEITKTRLALGSYNGMFDCIRKIVVQEGFSSLYKGLTPSLMGIIPYAGVDLAIYSTLKERYAAQHPGSSPSGLTLVSFGLVSSSCGQVVAYPLQLVRTRLQAQGMNGSPLLYRGMVDCFTKTYNSGGWKGLYRGILPNFMKALPAVSISYVVYEKTTALLK